MQLLQYKENRERGSFGFPIELYHIDCHHPQYVMSYHWHLEYELIRVLEGEFDYVVDDLRGTAQAGDLLFLRGGLLHAGTPRDCVYECIVFDMGLLYKQGEPALPVLQALSDHQLEVRVCMPREDGEIHEVANKLFDVLGQKEAGYQLVTQGLLYQLFGIIVARHYYEEVPAEGWGAQRKMTQLKKALAVIETQYAGPITLDELADAAGMTPKYFCRFFSDMTGYTPINYLNYHRIEVAAFQMAAGRHSVTEIAYECGFNDLSYFIRVFKKYKGMTPKRYIKQLEIPE